MSFATRYQQLDDRESEESQNVKPFVTVSKQDHWGYRTAFWGLSFLYIVTIGVACVALAAKNSSHHYTSEDLTLIHARIPHDQTVVFAPLEQFEIVGSSQSVDDPWRELLPKGRGFVHIPVGTELQDGTYSSEEGYYAISMFHQMHCIASLKAAFESMSDNETKSTHSMDHYVHCFDYLLQGVMCAGDISLEPAIQVTKLDVESVDGWNVTHQCRNYQLIYDFAEKHRYLNTTGIL